MTDFEQILKQEKNENTALILVLGVISEKLTEIITLLADSKKEQCNNKKEDKFYMPLTSADFD